jgi:hypothetical protein
MLPTVTAEPTLLIPSKREAHIHCYDAPVYQDWLPRPWFPVAFLSMGFCPHHTLNFRDFIPTRLSLYSSLSLSLAHIFKKKTIPRRANHNYLSTPSSPPR